MDIRDAQPFLILGAAKCGTTSLFAYVGQHPDVFFSTPKEPVFFEAEYERGMDYYWSRYYRDWRGEPVVGEARTHNLMLPFVAPRVRESLPHARLIAIVRNPVDRAFSHWWHRHSRQLEPLGFADAIRANAERIESGFGFQGPRGEARWRESMDPLARQTTRYGLYLELGYYARQLRRYLELFPASQLKIVFFEDLSRSPLDVSRAVWEFLGVDPDRSLEDADAHNTANALAWSQNVVRMRRMLMTAARIPGWNVARHLAPVGLRDRLKAYVAGRPAQRPPLDRDTERWLIEHFAPHNRDLERLTGREVPHWFEPRDAPAPRTAEPSQPDGFRI